MLISKSVFLCVFQVELIEQGDTLTDQMHKLYRGVHHFVSDNIFRNYSENYSLEDLQTLDMTIDDFNGNRSSTFPQSKQQADMMLGFRLDGQISGGLQTRCINPEIISNIDKHHHHHGGGIKTNDDSAFSELCVKEESPVTVSSGYSSDKDCSLNHSTDDSPQHSLRTHHKWTASHSPRPCDSDVPLSTVLPQDSLRLNHQWMAANRPVSCDREVALIHLRSDDSKVEDVKPEGGVKSGEEKDQFVIEPDQMYEQNCSVCSSQRSKLDEVIKTDALFKPIVTESTSTRRNTSNTHMYATTRKRSDSYSLVRQTMKDIVKDLKEHSIHREHMSSKSKVSRSQSLFEKHSHEHGCFAESKQKDVTPPPISSLPGYHPAWCVKNTTHSMQPGVFRVSPNSAFHPYHSGSSTPEELTEGNSATYWSNSVCFNKEPVYASLKRMSLKCSKSETGTTETTSDHQRQRRRNSQRNSANYESIDNEPIYEHVDGANEYHPKIPPKLPARNLSSKYRKSNSDHPERKHPARRHTLKLEDIVKPNDIVHSSGKHMYTVSDILQSVDRLNQDIPVNQQQTPLKNGGTKLRRSKSHYSVATNSSSFSSSHSFSSCEGSAKPRPIKRVKKLVSPIKATRNDCNMALTKKLYSVDDIVGLIVIPTQYGLQFEANTQSQQNINWVTTNTADEIFC